MPPKNPFHTAAEDVLRKVEIEEKIWYMNKYNKSAKEADAWFTTRKGGGSGAGNTSEFGFKTVKTLKMPRYNKTLWNLIMEDSDVVAAQDHYNGKLDKSWFDKRKGAAWVTKGRMSGKRKLGERKLGEMTDIAANTKYGSAVEAFENGKGLVEFMGSKEETITFLRMMESLRSRKEDARAQSVTNRYGLGVGCFDLDSDVPHKLAVERINELLAKAAKKWDIQVDTITIGMNTEDFLSHYSYGIEEGLKELEEDCRQLAKEEAEEVHLEATRDYHIISARGSETFLTASNLLVAYKNIVQGLKDSTLGVIRDKDHLLRFFIVAGKKMKNQRCIGSLVQNNIDPDDFEEFIHTTGFICVEQFTCVGSSVGAYVSWGRDPSVGAYVGTDGSTSSRLRCCKPKNGS